MRGVGGQRPIVVAHRGGAAEAPENTVEAFERAIRLGYAGVEFDVRCSRDGFPVVVHDERILTGSRSRRPVADLPAAELGMLPTLDAVLALPWGSTVLMVEVKPTTRDRELGGLAARAIVAHGLGSQVVLASFSRDVLQSAVSAVPGTRIMALLDDRMDPARFEGLIPFGWGLELPLVSPDRMAFWRKGGREVWTWTIKDLADLRWALDAGVDGLITDIPGAVLKALDYPDCP